MKKVVSVVLVILMCVTYLSSCVRRPDLPDVIDTTNTESETFKDEEIKDETPKDETPKDETPKDETPKDETPKDETPKDETPKDETPKDETPKDEPQEPSIPPELIVNVPPTDFAAKFSPENEALLETILASPIKEVSSVENVLPSLTVNPSKKYASGDGGYTYIYGNVGKAIYDNTCHVLFKNGFAKYTENAINAGADDDETWKLYNYSATFINDTAQIDIDLHTGTNRMFINVTPRASSVLPQREAKSYVKPQGNYPTLWVQYGLEDIDDKESSLGYIIRIADGSFIIVDGGELIDGVEVRMYEILKKLAPDPDNIVISAWIITHTHGDHVGGFLKFADKYINDPTIKVKQIVCNFPDDTKIPKSNNGEDSWEKILQDHVREYSKTFGAEFLKVQTGNVLYYADIKINILYTQANYLDSNVDGMMSNFNGASVVTQFVMADGSKVLVGADHPVDGTYNGVVWCQNALVRWYGTGLRSQVVSTFHHGYGGGADNYIYGVIKPQKVLWGVDYARVTASSLTTFSHNKYFTTNGKANNVTYHMASGSSVTILQFANGTPTLTFYSTFSEFKAS